MTWGDQEHKGIKDIVYSREFILTAIGLIFDGLS